MREQIEALERMARALAEGNFEAISLERAARAALRARGRSLILLRDLERDLREAGFLRPGQQGLELTPRAIRRIGAQALAAVYAQLRKGRPGSHDTVQHGVGARRAPTRRAPGSSATRSTSTSCARC